MSVNNIYLYFNKKGELISKAPYIDNGNIRQGSDFILNLLFDEDMNFNGSMLELEFKSPGQTKFGYFPFISYYDENLNNVGALKNPFTKLEGVIKFEQDLTRYGISRDTPYQCWQFNTNAAKMTDYLTEVDGNLEAKISIYDENNNKSILGLAKIFIEKTIGYQSKYEVSKADLDRFIEETKRTSENIARTQAWDVMPDKYIKDILPSASENHIVLEKFTKEGLENSEIVIELPLPHVANDVDLELLEPEETSSASVTGSGKIVDPLRFSFNIPKARDGYGLYEFEIREDGYLYVHMQSIDAVSQDDFTLDEDTGELIVTI